MTSISLPVLPEKITKSNFPRTRRQFLDLIIMFGRPAKEILRGTRILLVAPTKTATDANGDRLYAVDDTGALTAEGLSDFNFDRTVYLSQFQESVKHTTGLLAFMLSSLSDESKITLETKPGYDIAKSNEDTFGLWALILETHMVGSGRTKQYQMLQFLGLKQTSSHEEYLSQFNQIREIVLGYFESPLHKGFVSFDLICRCVYLNGVDPVFFSRQIDKAIEDKPDVSSERQ